MTALNRFTRKTAPLILFVLFLAAPGLLRADTQKIQVEHYPNGQIHLEIEIDEHRRPHGWTREYSENGALKSERQYEQGVRHGISRLYYITGQLMTEWNYRDGKRHGPSIGYFRNGRIKDKGSYEDDRLEGTVLKYYPSGSLKVRMIFKEGRPEGQTITYDESGRVQYVYHYRKGRVRIREEYSPDGKLLRKQEFPKISVLP